MKLAKLASAVSLVLVAAPAWSQTAPVTKERVEVTGSNIKRTQEESALPLFRQAFENVPLLH